MQSQDTFVFGEEYCSFDLQSPIYVINWDFQNVLTDFESTAQNKTFTFDFPLGKGHKVPHLKALNHGIEH